MSVKITIFYKSNIVDIKNMFFEPHTPEYVIADESYQLSLAFAYKQLVDYSNDYAVACLLKDIDYQYSIKE